MVFTINEALAIASGICYNEINSVNPSHVALCSINCRGSHIGPAQCLPCFCNIKVDLYLYHFALCKAEKTCSRAFDNTDMDTQVCWILSQPSDSMHSLLSTVCCMHQLDALMVRI